MNQQLKGKIIFDTSQDKEYYRKMFIRNFKYGEIPTSILGTVVFLSFGIWLLLNPSHFRDVPQALVSFTSFIAIFGGLFFFLFPIYSWMKNKLDLEKGLFGVRVDENGIKFFDRGKQWKFSDIEFVFVDENYHPLRGYIVIKTKKTPPVNVADELLRNPKKFWLAIHWKDRRNYWDTRVVKDINEFIRVLSYYGVKIYWRKKNSPEIVEVHAENLK